MQAQDQAGVLLSYGDGGLLLRHRLLLSAPPSCARLGHAWLLCVVYSSIAGCADCKVYTALQLDLETACA